MDSVPQGTCWSLLQSHSSRKSSRVFPSTVFHMALWLMTLAASPLLLMWDGSPLIYLVRPGRERSQNHWQGHQVDIRICRWLASSFVPSGKKIPDLKIRTAGPWRTGLSKILETTVQTSHNSTWLHAGKSPLVAWSIWHPWNIWSPWIWPTVKESTGQASKRWPTTVVG